MKAMLLIALLGGIAATGAAQSPPGPSYFALGAKPGWTLEITPSHVIYYDQKRAKQIVEPHRGAVENGPISEFSSQSLTATITPGPCQITAGGRRYAEHVRLSVAGQQRKGCGGALLPAADLAGSLWRFSHIGGVAVADPAQTELRFAGTQMSGTAGCNRFSGGYIARGGEGRYAASLNVGALVMTKMACMGPAGAQEEAALGLFGGPLVVSFERDGAMLLTSANGHSARLVRRP